MLKFKLVTPERVLLEKEVDSITLPTETGEITVLENHIPLISNLIAGEIYFRHKNVEDFIAVSSGTIEVSAQGGPTSGENNSTTVIVLADTAEFGQEIDPERAEKARERAVKLMQESYHDEKVMVDVTASLAKHLARLKVARKHRKR
jgi:F-type H+-transporting ATPase subunit epsilon